MRASVIRPALPVLDECPVAQLAVRLLQLFARVHHDGPVPGHRLFNGSARHEEKADALVARLHRHIVAIVEQHERPISGTLEYWCVRPDTLREYSARIGRIAECARALEDV